MDTDLKQILKGNWNIVKGNLKQKYAELTDDDLQYVEGKEEELLGRLQKKLGLTLNEAKKMIQTNSSDK